MRSLITILLVAVLALAATGGPAASGPIVFNTMVLDRRFLDIGARGPTVGDTSIRRWRLTTRQGKPLGFGYEVCRWISATTRLCDGVYSLPLGQIAFQGTLGTGDPLVVVGGTRSYVHDDGEIRRQGRAVFITLT